MDALAGRRLNFNEHDDSWVFRAKTRDDIEARLAGSHRRMDTLSVVAHQKIAYKMVSIMPFLAQLGEYYPSMKIIVMYRSPESVCSSMLRKGWFTDADLSADAMTWPMKSRHAPAIPPWVPDKDIELWTKMEQKERCYYYYLRMYECVPSNENVLMVDYDSLIRQPCRVATHLVAKLACDFGEKTGEVLGNIRDQGAKLETSLEDVNDDMQRKLRAVSERCRALVLTA